MEVRKMKTLELEPLEKKWTVLMVEKEYDEPLWEHDEVLFPRLPKALEVIRTPSAAFREFLWELLTKEKPDFVTEERGRRSEREFYEENPIAQICSEKGIPLYPADVDENARYYLEGKVSELKEKRDEILKVLARKKKSEKLSPQQFEYLKAYVQYLHQELEEEMRKAEFEVREAWITMGILERARKVEKDEVLVVHLSSPRHIEGVAKLLRSMGANLIHVKLEKKALPNLKMNFPPTRLGRDLELPGFEVTPAVRIVEREEMPFLLFFLDTEPHVSPFDISLAYDVGFDAVIPYAGVKAEDARNIVQDALFSRGPKGVKRSTFLIGGKSLEEAEKILKVVKESMFPPFETSVVIDPHGAYTTSAALVAKIEEGVKKLGMVSEGLKAVVLAGTGPVGMASATLLGRLGFQVYLTSRKEERARKSAQEILERWGVKVEGIQVDDQEKTFELLRDAYVVVASGAPGVELVSEQTLERLEGSEKIMADVNAVPPSGIAGLRPDYDLQEFRPRIFGIGALAVGKLKNKTEKEILTRAKTMGKGVYDLDYAFKTARELLRERKREMKLAPLQIAY
ncbi:MAG: NAD(P)-dependent methylenetetrahydromethanopterin dehydrogenase [Candidatus Hadarchaeales archaeon]